MFLWVIANGESDIQSALAGAFHLPIYQRHIKMDTSERFHYHRCEPSPSTFAVDTAVEKPIPSFTHPRLPGNSEPYDAIARLSCVRCEGESSLA